MESTMRLSSIRSLFVRAAWCLAAAAGTAGAAKEPPLPPPAPKVGIKSIEVELPQVLREVAGNGKLSPVTRALVEVAFPPGFDAKRSWPILVINATSDPKFNSSRALMRRYADVATSAGWVIVAADANRELVVNQDNVKLRLALGSAALAALQAHWPEAANAPLAFGGFSGGAKHSGWLAAAFVAQERKVIGVFQAGINEESFVKGGKQFDVVDDAFKRIPVFLLGGERDRMASPSAHRNIEKQLRKAGVLNVKLELIEGGHHVAPAPLAGALEWFEEMAAKPS
jgi:predicted esterase